MKSKEQKEEVKKNTQKKSAVRDTTAGYYVLELKKRIKIFQGGKGT